MASSARNHSLLLELFQYALIFLAVKFLYEKLPEPKHPDDANRVFSAFSAKDYVDALADLGPRVTGSSANENDAVNVLQQALKSIQSKSKWPVEIDSQIVDGDYFIDQGDGMNVHYVGVQNVIARLMFDHENGNDGAALLINCHFDSVPHSPGASDDAVSCGIMLEILRILSTHQEPLLHDIIFLFNGAEETILPASHGFITKHPWAKDVGIFINLEAAGAGGREVLFQSGPGNIWLLKTYLRSAPHPSCSVVGQEIFQAKLIPSDTDFRIFRDYGNLSGLDIAYVKNGYVYHTKYDTADRIPLGSIQRAGENVLEVTKSLAKMEKFPLDDKNESSPVFFEILGHFPLSYPGNVGFVLNIICSCLALYSSYKHIQTVSKKTDNSVMSQVKLIIALSFGRLLCLVLALLLMSFSSSLFQAFGKSMSWFTNTWLIIPLYAFPTLLITMVLIEMVSGKHRTTIDEYGFDVIQLEFVLATLVGSFLGIRSTYIPMTLVLFPLLNQMTMAHMSMTMQKKLDAISPFLNPFFLLPLINVSYLSLILITFFVPIMGRRGSGTNPDFIIGGMTVLLTHFVTAYVVPKIPMASDNRATKNFLCYAWFLSILLVLFTFVGFPYNSNHDSIAPQRITVQHTLREFRNWSGEITLKDSGISIEKQDFNDSPELMERVIGYKNGVHSSDCTNADLINCGHPLDRANVHKKKKLVWIPFPPPKLSREKMTSLELIQKDLKSKKAIRMEFSLVGPNRIVVVLAPPPGSNISNWSLTNETESGNLKWKGRQGKYLWFIRGKTSCKICEVRFWIEIERGEDSGEPLVAAVSGHVQFGEEMIQPDFSSYLNSFPDWTFPWAWTVDSKVYEFRIVD